MPDPALLLPSLAEAWPLIALLLVAAWIYAAPWWR